MTLDLVPLWRPMEVRELMDKNGSHSLAREIRRHWAQLGWKVNVWIDHQVLGLDKSKHIYGVRSDLIAGRPRERLHPSDKDAHLASEVQERMDENTY